MTKYPAPSPTYLGPPAKHSGNGNKPIRRVVIHSAVMPCEPGRARQLATMNRVGSGGGSWHYAVDPGTTIQCSYDSVVCWHAPPNSHSIGIEMADWPEPMPAPENTTVWKRNRLRWRWAKPAQMRMLLRTAKLTAELCLAYDLPITWLSAADLKAGRQGITSHANVSAAWRQSTHWDPGYWPRAGFMNRVRAHAKKIQKAGKKTEKKTPSKPSRVVVSKNLKGSRGRTKAGRAAIEADLRALTKDSPLVVALQEVPGALPAIRAVLGKRYKRLGGGGETRMYVHQAAKIHRKGTVKFRTKWRGPKGRLRHGRTWPAGLVEHGGKMLDVLDIHQIWSRAKNRAAWNDGLAKIRKYAANHPMVPMLIPGDYNMRADHPDAVALARAIGGTIVHTGPNALDWAIYRPAKANSQHARKLTPKGQLTPKRGSDHHGTRFTGI